MLKECLENVRKGTPLVHCITNYVTVNDCANLLLACGGSPIMADDSSEVCDITSLCGGLVINIGTLNQRTIPAMHLAGERANALGHPVVLDPVGAGASALRTKTAASLLENVQFSVIRGNISEIKCLALGTETTQGVDASDVDAVTEETLPAAVRFAKHFAGTINAVVAITGAVDIVTDGRRTAIIRNGDAMMRGVTGTGCMLSAMIGAYAAANPEQSFAAAVAAVCAMGLCGELAKKRLTDLDGNAAYRNFIIDAAFHLDGDMLERGAKYELQ